MKGLILTIELYNCDYREIAKPHMCQMLLTDLPYEKPCNKSELLSYCTGNIITFCAPENQYYQADEYAFWYKTPSTKNYTRKHCNTSLLESKS